MSSTLRAVTILRVLLKHRVDELLTDTPWQRWRLALKLLAPWRRIPASTPRGERLRLALEALGPIFVKFGQVLSTRRDVLPEDIAQALALLRDRVAPFDGSLAIAEIERVLQKPLAESFASFDANALASASIAQVHAARLHDGSSVVVKVLRPGVRQQIATDMALLKRIAAFVQARHPHGENIQPLAVVAEIEGTLLAELDLQREGANACVMRRLWENQPELSVPQVHWQYSGESVLTLERVNGIGADDLPALDAAGVDRRKLAALCVRLFYTQVFRDNFFHADAHAGNVWVDAREPQNPKVIALDFGIVGQLSERDQYFLAENFLAIFRRDYHRVAELHVQAGWMPKHVRLDAIEADVRAICEPYFTRPLAQLPLGEVLSKLFRAAQRHQLTLQPQLILLQKTLLNIEGLSRQLDPEIDIWSVAEPVLSGIVRERRSPRAMFSKLRKQLPQWASQWPALPSLFGEWLQQQVQGEQVATMRSRELEKLALVADKARRQANLRFLITISVMTAMLILLLQ